MIYADKQEVQGDGPFLDGINVTIRRNYIYEDAYDKLSPENGTYHSLCMCSYDRGRLGGLQERVIITKISVDHLIL